MRIECEWNDKERTLTLRSDGAGKMPVPAAVKVELVARQLQNLSPSTWCHDRQALNRAACFSAVPTGLRAYPTLNRGLTLRRAYGAHSPVPKCEDRGHRSDLENGIKERKKKRPVREFAPAVDCRKTFFLFCRVDAVNFEQQGSPTG